jgi:16S rRNA processing protein RimM
VTEPPTEWVTVAVLGKTRGNRGELTAFALTNRPERFQDLQQVYLFTPKAPATAERLEVEETWFHSGTLIFKFRGVDSISDAEPWVGSEVRVPFADRTTLDEGEYFQSDLVGCKVFDRRTGELVGEVTGFDEGGGAGILVVGELLIPFARSICVEIDPAARRIAVELPEGLKDLNRT